MEGTPNQKSRVEELKEEDLNRIRVRIDEVKAEIEEKKKKISEMPDGDERRKIEESLGGNEFEISMQNDQIEYIMAGKANEAYVEVEKKEKIEKLIEEMRKISDAQWEKYGIVVQTENEIREITGQIRELGTQSREGKGDIKEIMAEMRKVFSLGDEKTEALDKVNREIKEFENQKDLIKVQLENLWGTKKQ